MVNICWSSCTQWRPKKELKYCSTKAYIYFSYFLRWWLDRWERHLNRVSWTPSDHFHTKETMIVGWRWKLEIVVWRWAADRFVRNKETWTPVPGNSRTMASSSCSTCSLTSDLVEVARIEMDHSSATRPSCMPITLSTRRCLPVRPFARFFFTWNWGGNKTLAKK